MKLITEAKHTELLANARAVQHAAAAGAEFDPKPVVKLSTRDGYYRWLLSEIDPGGSDLAATAAPSWAMSASTISTNHKTNSRCASNRIVASSRTSRCPPTSTSRSPAVSSSHDAIFAAGLRVGGPFFITLTLHRIRRPTRAKQLTLLLRRHKHVW
jgi:Protein of unknown function (DUF2958)